MFKNYKNKNGGEMEFGVQIILFIVLIFIVWVLMGGPNKSRTKDDPFIVPLDDPYTPGRTYGPGERVAD